MRTKADIAEELRVSPATVAGWIATGELRAVDLRRKGSERARWRVTDADLNSFLSGRSNEKRKGEPRKARRLMKAAESTPNLI